MNLKSFIETLQKAGVEATEARGLALKRFGKENLDETMREFYPEFKHEEAAPEPTTAPEPVKELKRNANPKDIIELCEIAGRSEMAIDFIKGDMSVEQVRAKLIEERAKKDTPMGNDHIKINRDEKDSFRAAATEGLSIRVDAVKADTVKNPLSHELRKLSLSEMARECVEMESPGSTRRMSRVEIAQRALAAQTGDFPYILANTQGKIVAKAYQDAPRTWNVWANVSESSDFKTKDIVQMHGASAIKEVKAGEDPQYVKFSDSREQVQIKSYGAAYGLGFQAIVNDDLDMFARVPSQLGAACARKVNKDVYAVLHANANMADGGALFNNTAITTAGGHANLLSQAAISNTTIGEAFVKMRRQKDAQSNILNLVPYFILVPATKEELALQYLSEKMPVVPTSASGIDVWRGRLTIVSDAEMDENSTTAYYFVANKSLIDTVTVYFLDGNQTPTVREEESSVGRALGRNYDVYLHYIPKAIEWRGISKNAGA
jgi:hypothetical protein